MFDIATRYMLYVRRERTGCIVPDFTIQVPIYLYTGQDGRHAQKYYGVMRTYIIFNHVMKTLLSLAGQTLALVEKSDHAERMILPTSSHTQKNVPF